jgi:AcrR family transcriptional regulator
MSSSVRTYQGKSAENRIGTRRRRLMDVGFELMANGGWRLVTIDGLCRRAELNKRYFYESFANLDALADAVVDDLTANLLSIGLEAARASQRAGLTIEALSRDTMKKVIGWLVSDRRRAQVLFSEAGDNPRAQSHRKAVIRQLAHEISVFGHEFHGATEPHAIAQVGASLLIGGSIESLLGWLNGDIDISLDEFVEDIAGFWVAVGDYAVDLAKRRLKKAASKKISPVKSKPQKKRTR